ncbi:hypothetical protein CspeluHIS016_0403900 [Cutaneotrichosporon spelunceum]|uniref:Inhibitor of growth protein N-terminal histone-binding domain-containing protein n=1 Tax=Cutaneotrichosporon spelunceum TaxID=1672016 RepID=A0AAD3TVY1_9TREE|nr:hypothetical protein CspeluHIS016_0403900 [Cutaneotrichosporon spelunceum]
MSRRSSRRVAAPETEPSPPSECPKRGVDKLKEDMSDDQVAELWAQFAADHYEIVEQLPLELHRNSQLLRELDAESLSQQTRLQARIREYVACRIPMARPRVERETTEVDVKPCVSEEPTEPQVQVPQETENTLVPAEPREQMEKPAAAAASPRAGAGVPVPVPVPGAQSTPDTWPALPEETEEHDAEAAVEEALEAEPLTPRASVPAPHRAYLSEIASLVSELVRNREEKVAIAVGAYNTIDRHIRALDSALSAHETSVLGFASAEAQTEPEPEPESGPRPKKRQRQKRSISSSVPPLGLPAGIEADPNEPRYCYCHQVSYGEMVGTRIVRWSGSI